MQDDFERQTSAFLSAVEDVMDVHSYRRPQSTADPKHPFQFSIGFELVGRLLRPADLAYDTVAERFRSLGHIALFRRRGDDHVIFAVPGALPQTGGRPWVAIVLFVATVISVLWTGAISQQFPGETFDWLEGVPFAASLMGILLAHEMGHFLISRHFGTATSFPYFIPLPGLSIVGTMGAVMQMKAPPKNRRQLLAIGAAGPLAGLVVAIPLLVYGLQLSPVLVVPRDVPTFQEGNSILYAALKYLVFGRFLPAGGEDVFLHPVALAGWTGLLVTALNLIPAGQLDGGHILYAMFGERSRPAAWVIMLGLAVLAVLWQGWIVWALLIFFFGRVQAVPLDDITQLEGRHRLFGAFMLLVAALVFVPIPLVVN